MTARVLMVQGTMSHAGKSLLTAALCRIFTQDGYSVAPFKAQNMSNNAAVVPDGGEIGRAQMVQAEAARAMPRVEMNPILLKPEADHRSQVVVMGRATRAANAREYYTLKAELWPVVTEALDTLRREYDVVVIEGAGSPAEINLREQEIVNMRVAKYAHAPVLLVGDIDRGGVFAQLVGTMALLEPDEAALVKAFVINKFRGDVSILEPGLAMLTERTGVPVAGVVPYLKDLAIPEEDGVDVERQRHNERPRGTETLEVAVIRLPHIANFDDFDPLAREPSVRLRYVTRADDLSAADLIVLPGTKTTVADLAWLRERGFDKAIRARHAAGAAVIGVCGGYQMLGRRIRDPDVVESPQRETDGLGLLAVETRFEGKKATHRVRGKVIESRGLLSDCADAAFDGYEIHMGRTTPSSPALRIVERSSEAVDVNDGMLDADGRVLGTYVHGLFHNDAIRHSVLRAIARRKGVALPQLLPFASADAEFDKLADAVRNSLDMDFIYRSVGLESRHG
ncbi:MAG: cobyric acid synthase [Chloroflexi bacterium]|nr:cobyric acid synthase [Chloroflexota bacterium]